MSRAVLILINADLRAKAKRWIDGVPDGTRLEFKAPKRTLPQNDLLHALIGEIITQRPIHNGIKMDMALWKASFMQALGEEVRFVPTLDGDGVFPVGLRTSELSKERFSELVEFIHAWCAGEGIDIECNHVTAP